MELFYRNLAEYLLVVLAGIAIIAFVLMLFEIFRSAAFSYIMVIMIGFNILEPIICNLIALINSKLEIAKHLILTQFSFINGDLIEDAGGEIVNVDPDPIWTFWVRTGLYLAVFLVTAIVVSRKKDTV